jgi:hypothetical protein
VTRTLLTLTLALIPSLALAQQPAADGKVYELRTYYASPGKLDDLHARFRTHTVKLYERHGITSVGYWVPADNRENKLVCLVAHPTEAARRTAWARLAADPEWIRVQRISERDGKLVDAIADKLLTPAEVTALTATAAPDAEPRVFELRTYTTAPGKLSQLTAEVRVDGKRMSERTGATPVASWTPTAGQKGADTTLVALVAYQPVDRDRSLISMRSNLAAAATGIALVGGVEAKEPDLSVVLVPTDYSPLK